MEKSKVPDIQGKTQEELCSPQSFNPSLLLSSPCSSLSYGPLAPMPYKQDPQPHPEGVLPADFRDMMAAYGLQACDMGESFPQPPYEAPGLTPL